MRTVLKCAIGRWSGGRLDRGAALALSSSAALIMAGCGSGGGMAAGQAPPPPPTMKAVTVVLSSTANDQLSQFDIGIQGISLTSASGRKVSVLSQGRQTEFIHVNGAVEPLITAMIPQDVYTAATVTVGSASFTCIALQPNGGLIISEFGYEQTPTSDVTVTLPAAILVSGDTAGLALDMLVSPSASWTSCNAGPSSPYAITPTFTLSAFGSSSPAAASQNAAVAGLDGQVTALDSDSGGFQITLPASTSIHVIIGSATVWQGISSLTELHQGMFVDLDGALRSDGSMAASRVAVEDTSAVNVQRGPLLLVASAVPILDMYPRQAQGKDMLVDYEQFSFNGSRFQVFGGFSNLQALPFTPSFSADNMVAGQTVYVSTPAFAATGNYDAVANTITLVPQTVNGTVTGVGISGDFSVYTVSLAPYDLLSLLATQPGQTTLLTSPGVIEVYVDTNTVMPPSSAPAPGDTLRFYGLVFNDHGTLRMDCARIGPGVTELSQWALTVPGVARAAVGGDSGKSTGSGMLRALREGRLRHFPAPFHSHGAPPRLGPSPAAVCLAFRAMDQGQGVLNFGQRLPGE